MKDAKVSVDEMWEVIEEFGIKRDVLERTHPGIEVIKELCNSILQKNKERKTTNPIIEHI